jgi:hypothetical protein
MKTFLKKFFANNPVNINELVPFISTFCERKGKSPTSQQLIAIVQLIQMGQINLESVCLEAAQMENIQVYKIFNKDEILLCYKLIENE